MSHPGAFAVVFVDYLTKWPEVFPTADQTALTIAQLLATKVISRHGVPGELLSDWGAAFLSLSVEQQKKGYDCGLFAIAFISDSECVQIVEY